MDWDVVTPDRILTFLGVVLAGLAALFAYPIWKDSRARPDLRLTAQPRDKLNVENERGLRVRVAITIDNVGAGAATDSRLTILSRGSPIAGDFDPSPEWRVVDPWNIEWSSTRADDTIGVGLSKQASFVTSRLMPGEGIGILFALSARRMKKPQAGSFHVVVEESGEASVVYGPNV